MHPCFCTQNSFQLQNFVSPPLFLLLLPRLGGRGSVVKEKRDLKVRGRAGCNTAKTTELLYSSASSTIACTPSYFAPVELSRVLVIRFPHYRRHKGGERSSSHAALPHCPQPNFTQLSILPQPSFYIHTFCSSFSLLFIIFSACPFLRGQIARITSARRTRRVPAFGYTAVPTLHLCTVLTQETLSLL